MVIVKAGSARPRFADDGVGHIVAVTVPAAAKAASSTVFAENMIMKGLERGCEGLILAD